MAIIRLRRNVGAGNVALPAPQNEGELVYALNGFTGLPAHPAGTSDIVIYASGQYRTVVGPTRQVEMTGNQVIGGQKTFGGTALFTAPANISIGGGANGNILTTNGAGGLSWQPPSVTGIQQVESDATLSGLGIVGNLLSVVVATAGARGAVAPVAGNPVTVAPGTGNLGLTVANAGQIATGTDPAFPIASAGLRTQMGADAATLTTNIKTVVPAINELKANIDALTGNMTFGGIYNAATNLMTPTQAPGNPFGNTPGVLPLPTAPMIGWYLIVSVGGAGIGNAPAGTYSPGDWLAVAPAAPAQWVHIPTGAVTAYVDGVSIKGDGTSPAVGSAFYVDDVDGGQFPPP